MTKTDESQDDRKIVVEYDGPYKVEGNIPLVRKTQVVSEYGEPLTWKKGETIETKSPYFLCRCGLTKKEPFCDGAHHKEQFDGKETADTDTTAERQIIDTSGTNIVVKHDYSLCMNSGFCGNRVTNVDEMISETDDTRVRAQVMAMIERCPAGSLAYSLKEGEEDIEPDLPQQIALTTEITSNGPIEGSYWVTGNIPVIRSDGQPFETRNRVTLCNCGKSRSKPLCDGTHRPRDF
jgi:CDGSH-type Zn-finger protein